LSYRYSDSDWHGKLVIKLNELLTVSRYQPVSRGDELSLTFWSNCTKATVFATTVFLLGLNINPAQAADSRELKTIENIETTSEHVAATPETEKKNWVKCKLLIKAPPKIVWEAVHEERKHDPDMAYSKVLEQGVNEAKLEQKFTVIPVIGTTTCVMHQNEIPLQRIDYKMIKSDHLKAMEGSWVFTPAENGKSTILELSTHLDLGIPMPWGGKTLMNSFARGKIEKRLNRVNDASETLLSEEIAKSQHLREVADSNRVKTE
jgi:hypothetical protein